MSLFVARAVWQRLDISTGLSHVYTAVETKIRNPFSKSHHRVTTSYCSVICRWSKIITGISGELHALVMGHTSVVQELELRIKWPNDIYYGDKFKIGGVLITTHVIGDVITAAIGVLTLLFQHVILSSPLSLCVQVAALI